MSSDLSNMCPAFYVSERGDVHTTGCYVTPDDEANIHKQLVPEILNIENETEVMIIVRQPDRWDVCVKGRFTPIGCIYVLAMLDPDWRP